MNHSLPRGATNPNTITPAKSPATIASIIPGREEADRIAHRVHFLPQIAISSFHAGFFRSGTAKTPFP
jgi:hypothetical protein